MPLSLVKHRNRFALAAFSEVLWNLEYFHGCYNHRLKVTSPIKRGALNTTLEFEMDMLLLLEIFLNCYTIFHM
jgi:hypothetical protein